MIRFALKCENDHRFESWFQSGTAFDALQERGMVTCPECCSTHVAKDLKAEAKDLIDDGVPAVPLPFIPRQKTN